TDSAVDSSTAGWSVAVVVPVGMVSSSVKFASGACRDANKLLGSLGTATPSIKLSRSSSLTSESSESEMYLLLLLVLGLAAVVVDVELGCRLVEVACLATFFCFE